MVKLNYYYFHKNIQNKLIIESNSTSNITSSITNQPKQNIIIQKSSIGLIGYLKTGCHIFFNYFKKKILLSKIESFVKIEKLIIDICKMFKEEKNKIELFSLLHKRTEQQELKLYNNALTKFEPFIAKISKKYARHSPFSENKAKTPLENNNNNEQGSFKIKSFKPLSPSGSVHNLFSKIYLTSENRNKPINKFELFYIQEGYELFERNKKLSNNLSKIHSFKIKLNSVNKNFSSLVDKIFRKLTEKGIQEIILKHFYFLCIDYRNIKIIKSESDYNVNKSHYSGIKNIELDTICIWNNDCILYKISLFSDIKKEIKIYFEEIYGKEIINRVTSDELIKTEYKKITSSSTKYSYFTLSYGDVVGITGGIMET